MPRILSRLHEELAQAPQRPWAHEGDGLVRVLSDPELAEAHVSLLPPRAQPATPLEQNRLEGLRLKFSHNGPANLSSQERRELLLDADSIRKLQLDLRPQREPGTNPQARASARAA